MMIRRLIRIMIHVPPSTQFNETQQQPSSSLSLQPLSSPPQPKLLKEIS